MPVRCRLWSGLLLLMLAGSAWAGKKVELDYHIRLLPQSDQAEVRLTLAQGSAVRSLDFALGAQGYYTDFKADGQWLTQPDQAGTGSRGIWRPAAGKASLSYRVSIGVAPGVRVAHWLEECRDGLAAHWQEPLSH